ncbi:multiple antibiotic resistance (MarC)-related protein [Desulfovibrio sp. X2]|uniref:MarC family protein n=1 Tax=Desulfovibrio sp. X2 TaxID=941449 RepID=UPI000358BCDC|nr:MarC family protein [Desulfovibrio sp. X2]EPR43806.1 multiple antibiotic resistance (MarC)-related protein [Desulfovibrio sp. X2]
MSAWISSFLLAFIPLFVAIDPVGMAGMFVGLTDGIDDAVRNKVAKQAAVTAYVVTLAFMGLGSFIFKALGITIADFQIAGGLILLIVSTRGLLDYERKAFSLSEDFGVVPLGLPLIAGPAVLSAVLVLKDTAGLSATVVAMTLCTYLTYLSMRHVRGVVRVLGKRGIRAVSKLIALLLVAFAVHMIRVGWQTL